MNDSNVIVNLSFIKDDEEDLITRREFRRIVNNGVLHSIDFQYGNRTIRPNWILYDMDKKDIISYLLKNDPEVCNYCYSCQYTYLRCNQREGYCQSCKDMMEAIMLLRKEHPAWLGEFEANKCFNKLAHRYHML